MWEPECDMLIALGGTSCVAIQPVCNIRRSASVGSGWEPMQVAYLGWD